MESKAKQNIKIAAIVMVAILALALSLLAGCSEQEPEEEEEFIQTEWTYGNPVVGYFTVNEPFSCIGEGSVLEMTTENASETYVFQSDDDDAIVQVTYNAHVASEPENKTMTKSEEKRRFQIIVDAFSDEKRFNPFTIKDADDGSVCVKVIDKSVLDAFAATYPDVAVNVKDPSVYVYLSPDFRMLIAYGDNDTARKIALSYKGDADDYERDALDGKLNVVDVVNVVDIASLDFSEPVEVQEESTSLIGGGSSTDVTWKRKSSVNDEYIEDIIR